MENRSFDDLLGARVDEFEKPQPLPVGSYHVLVKDYGKTEKQSAAGNNGVVVQFSVLSPLDDVDADELRKVTAKSPLSKKVLRHTFWLTEDAAHRIRTFIEYLGITVEGRTLREVLPEIKGRPIIVSIRHKPSDRNPEEVYQEIGGFTKEVA